MTVVPHMSIWTVYVEGLFRIGFIEQYGFVSVSWCINLESAFASFFHGDVYTFHIFDQPRTLRAT